MQKTIQTINKKIFWIKNKTLGTHFYSAKNKQSLLNHKVAKIPFRKIDWEIEEIGEYQTDNTKVNELDYNYCIEFFNLSQFKYQYKPPLLDVAFDNFLKKINNDLLSVDYFTYGIYYSLIHLLTRY